MTQPRRPTVNLYCDFDGTISPLPERTPDQLQHQQACRTPAKSIADCYTLDRQQPQLLNMQWSSELAALMRDLVRYRYVRWHWLTSNVVWTDMFDNMLGLDSSLTVTEELITCHNGQVRLSAGGKVGIIRRALRAAARAPHPRAIAWLDDDYWAGQPEVDQLAELANQLRMSVLLITPDATVGLTRNQMRQLIEFILMDQRPIGLTNVS